MMARAPLCTVLASLLAASTLPGGDQPQWGEGWSRNMVSAETNLPARFDPATGEGIRWKAALGSECYSSPVVARGKVLIGANNTRPRDPKHEGDRGVFMCFDARTGDFLWQLVAPKITNSMFWDWPRAGMCSSATVEGDRAYMVNNRGQVNCLDLNGLADGNEGPFREEGTQCVPAGHEPLPMGATDADIVWLFDLVKECGVRQHDSAHSSILLHGQYLYLNTANGVDDSHKRITAPDAPSLVVLDKTTGRLVARDDEHIGPNIFHSTWSSPALGVVNGRSLVFFAGGNGIIYAFEPVTGPATSEKVATLRKVWQFDGDPGAPKENVHKYNSNRTVSPSNVKSMPVFWNNRVYVTLGGDVWWGKNEAWVQCVDATKTGDITAAGPLWTYPIERHVMSTVGICDGLLFVGDFGRKLHCVDAHTGKGYWTHELNGEIWSSPLVADGKVYVGTKKGEFSIFAASRAKQLLHQVQLDSGMAGTPAAANGLLYVATMKTLYAIGR